MRQKFQTVEKSAIYQRSAHVCPDFIFRIGQLLKKLVKMSKSFSEILDIPYSFKLWIALNVAQVWTHIWHLAYAVGLKTSSSGHSLFL